jgi:hypothetical protein
MRTWLEVHVDDVLLSKDPARWEESAALLRRLADIAAAEGGRLSFRVRAPFARGDRTGFLRGLADEGHEVGAHAHGRDLPAAVRALRQAGVSPTVMAPGFVQVGPRAAPALARLARLLGAEGLTDRLEEGRPAYAGWLPRRLPGGAWMLDVSVSPLAWGVVRLQRGRPVPAGGDLDWGALDRAAAVQAGWRPPGGRDAFFGATFHEHDVCAPGALGPAQAALDGLARWVSRWRPDVSAAAAVGVPPRPDRAAPRGTSGWLAAAGEGARRRAAFGGPLSPGPRREGLPPVHVVRAAAARVAVVGVHAGAGGLRERLGFLGLPDDAAGPAADLWLYARQPAGWPAPGNPAHADEARAVLAAAAAEHPVVLLSWSGGCVAAARGLLALSESTPALAARVRVFVDVEGPVDRLSLVKPGAESEWRGLAPHDDVAWAGRELIALFPRLAALERPPRYERWQGRPDHVHGDSVLHAERAVEEAGRAGLDTHLEQSARPLARDAARWLRALARVIARAAAVG